MGKKDFDFSGWATRNDLKCSDGRTIKKDAFIECDGKVVPLVWNHLHNDPTNVLGHALLENREEGVYTYGTFNDTPAGRNAKELVTHGDVTSLSIYANRLKQNGGDVLHGVIREVSLVLAGANPGASIDAILEHGDYGDEYSEEEAIIYTGEDLTFGKTEEIEHSEEKKEEEKVEETKELEHADEKAEEKEETIQDVVDSMSDKQKKVMYALIGAALEDGKKEQPEEGENKGEDMKHNVFDNDDKNTVQKAVFTVEDQRKVIEDGKRYGSLKDSFLAHSEEMGIDEVSYLAHDEVDGIEYSTGNQQYFVNQPSFLFPEARALNNPPAWIKRRTDWVATVMTGTHHTPFARIKSVFADITADEARAKGYVKGNLKTEEVFTLLKRTTTPCTVYKKQKMDRDDMIDITDFDVVAWIKGEMRIMLDEEIARAVLFGDGRSTASNDKIPETNIRPVWTDADLFTIKHEVTAGADAAELAENFIDAAVRSRKNYQGSGNPVLFTTEDMLTEMLLLKDQIGHRLYKSEQELATAMRVSKIVTVQVMENLTRSVTVEGVAKTATLHGLILNMNDYNIGADKGGAVSMFEDFDIDYNQQKYLIETRCSGALTKPYSAIALEVIA